MYSMLAVDSANVVLSVCSYAMMAALELVPLLLFVRVAFPVNLHTVYYRIGHRQDFSRAEANKIFRCAVLLTNRLLTPTAASPTAQSQML